MINCLPRLLLIAPRLSHCLAKLFSSTNCWLKSSWDSIQSSSENTIYKSQFICAFPDCWFIGKNSYCSLVRKKLYTFPSLLFPSLLFLSPYIFSHFKSATARITQDMTMHIYFLLMFISISKANTKVILFWRTAWLVLEKEQYLNVSKIRTSPR